MFNKSFHMSLILIRYIYSFDIFVFLEQITSDQFLTYLKSKGIDFCGLLEGGHMRDIENFEDFYRSISSALVNVKRSYQKVT